MNNFDFLKDKPEYRAFSKDCVDAEAAFRNSYDSCVKLVRTALDAAIKWLYVADKKNPPNNLFELIEHAGLDKNLAERRATPQYTTRKNFMRGRRSSV